MDDHDLQLLFQLYEKTTRQGPGSVETTRRALGLVPDDLKIDRILDLGCGTGGSTLVLAQDTDAHVTAVDIHPPFLATLRAQAEEQGVSHQITTLAEDMSNAAGLGQDFDLIWAEGSAYSVGFENAVKTWRPLLRSKGCLVVSELTWFTDTPAARAQSYFADEYPDMQDEATRMAQVKHLGFDILRSFRLPSSDWQSYYAGLEGPLEEAIAKHGELEIYTAAKEEAEVYKTCGDDYGYLCLILQKN